jgi:hypothetical protein
MSGLMSEYELEALPELRGGSFPGGEADRESERFFGALANLARRGASWLTAPGSPQRQMALAIARQVLNQGMPAIRQYGGNQAASLVSGLLPQQECECEFEVNPMRKIYPDAMMEHLGHAAAETHNEAEAEALAGAMVPLAARLVPRAAPIIVRATPGLVCGVSGLVRRLRSEPALRPLVRVVPAIVRNTATTLARQSAQGSPVTPQTALRILAAQTLRVLGNPRYSAHAFRRSQALDRQLHRHPAASPRICPNCGKIR